MLTTIEVTCVTFVQRGKTPIVAGGTGFYLRWFIYGKPKTPRSTPEGTAAAQETLDEVSQAQSSFLSLIMTYIS